MKLAKAVSIILVILASFILSCQVKESDKETIVIGAVLPLSGEVASYGLDSKKGIDLAIEQINASQDSIVFKVEYQDSQGDPKTAATALQQIISTYSPSAVIGENISSSTGAMIPIADKNKTILISPSASAPNLSGLSKYFFRVFPSDDSEGAFICKTIEDQHPNGKVSIIYVNNDYGVGLKNVFEKAAENNTLEVVGTYGFDPTQPNFQNLLVRVREANPDAIYIPSYYENGATLIKQIRQNGIQSDIYGCTTHEDQKLIDIAGEASEGFQYPIATGYDPKNESDIVKIFVANHTKRYGNEPGLVTALGYDCAQIVIAGILQKGNSSNQIRDYILNTPKIEGAAGTMSFDENGDVYKTIMLKKVINKQFQKVDY